MISISALGTVKNMECGLKYQIQGPISNPAESMNAVIKRWTQWKGTQETIVSFLPTTTTSTTTLINNTPPPIRIPMSANEKARMFLELDLVSFDRIAKVFNVQAVKIFLGIPVSEKEKKVNLGNERKRKRTEDKEGLSGDKRPNRVDRKAKRQYSSKPPTTCNPTSTSSATTLQQPSSSQTTFLATTPMP
ncbi:unnamed protein product, partial [Didymodactylos carnosus]